MVATTKKGGRKVISKDRTKLMEGETHKTIIETSIPQLLIIKRPIFPDDRGFFHEVMRVSDLEDYGINFKPVQWSHSYNLPNVIRAIHTEAWQKIIYPISGKLFTAFVDIRPDSQSFGKVETMIFDNTLNNGRYNAVYIPPGVGNSICVLGSSPVHYMYLVDEYWDNSKARGIAWDDKDLAIKWPIENPIISDRDKQNPSLRELFPDKFSK